MEVALHKANFITPRKIQIAKITDMDYIDRSFNSVGA